MKKLLSILFALVLVLSFSLVTAVPVAAQPSITIDGTLASGEWDGATSFGLDSAYTAYVTNDDEFMYVAFDYAVTTGSDFASFNTYKEGTFDPETINAPCVTSWGPVWDKIEDIDPADGVPETWHREDPSTRYEWAVNEATEMKVPLVELGLAPRDTIKMIFVLNVHMVGTYVYPDGAASFDLNTYATYSARVKNENTGFYYQSIQAAIDDADPYDTVLVHPGTYGPTRLVIDVPDVTLKAFSDDPADTTILVAGGGEDPIWICADGVTVEGFTFDHSTGRGEFNIEIHGGRIDGVTIRDNVIKYGYLLPRRADNFDIIDNQLVEPGPNGIAAYGSFSNVNIIGNTFSGGSSTWEMIFFVGGEEVELENVQISGNTFTMPNYRPHLIDQPGDLDIAYIFANNKFDRAVVVDHEGALLHTIWSSIQDGIDNASDGDTIDVAAGIYNERLTINTSLDLRGARYGVDPTPSGARTTPADESVITEAGLPTPNLDVLIEIPAGVLGVTVDGFTLNGDQTNTVADTSVVRIWGDNATISNNIIDGMFGVIYKGGDTLAVHQNRMVVNKVGVAVQPNPATNVTIFDNVITLGSNPVGDEQGIYMTGCSQSSVTGNTITSFIHNAALAGSHLDHLIVSGNNTFTGNAAGVSIWGGSTFITISGNVLSDSLATDWTDSGCGICIKGQDIVITGNQITNNADIGVKIDYHQIATERVSISQNNIADNANYGVWVNTDLIPETVDATNNYWGAASGPIPPGTYESHGDGVSANVDYEPWLLEEVVARVEPSTFDKTLALKDGWTLISTDKLVVATGSTWVGTNDLSPEDTETLITVLAYKYTPGERYLQVVLPDGLEPIDALYVKTAGGGGVGINYSPSAPGLSSKDLVAGWNLISSGTIADASGVLSPLRDIPEEGIGLTTLVSQGSYNQHTVGWYLDATNWKNLSANIMNPFDGYWIYMNAAKSFGVVSD